MRRAFFLRGTRRVVVLLGGYIKGRDEEEERRLLMTCERERERARRGEWGYPEELKC